MIVAVGFERKKIYSSSTLGPAYNDFGYYEHLHTTSKFFFQEDLLLIDINAWKVRLQWVPLIMSTFSWIKLFVVSGTQCTFVVQRVVKQSDYCLQDSHCYLSCQCLNFAAILPLLSQLGRQAEAGSCACEHATAVRLHLQKGQFLLVIISGTRLKFDKINLWSRREKSLKDSKTSKIGIFPQIYFRFLLSSNQNGDLIKR